MKSLTYIKPLYKLLIATIIGIIFERLLSSKIISSDDENYLLTNIMFFWDIFGIVYLILSWNIFFHSDADETKEIAKSQDRVHTLLFTILLAAIIMSFVAILVLTEDKNQRLVYISGAFISWMMLHTIFGVHYTNLYYNDADESGGGLKFPKDKTPDYIDFAYFSFIIGMTFQVSDVSITSGKIRRTVLWHSILSFLFNTFIIALSVNVIAGKK
ncbi:MAG: DUF1345 domain-containing protein [bacterium]